MSIHNIFIRNVFNNGIKFRLLLDISSGSKAEGKKSASKIVTKNLNNQKWTILASGSNLPLKPWLTRR